MSDRLWNDAVQECGPLRISVVEEALGCLMPEDLRPRLDNKPPKGRKCVADGVDRYGVHLVADKCRVVMFARRGAWPRPDARWGWTLRTFS